MKKIGAKITLCLLRVLSKLPKAFHYAVCESIAWLAGHVFRYRSDVVMVNIARSFPDKKYKELKKIYNGFYKNLGDIIAETIIFADCTSVEKTVKKGLCTSSYGEEFLEAYENAPGTVVLCSHCGNWELLGGWLAYLNEDERKIIGKEKFGIVHKELTSAVSEEVFGTVRTGPMQPGFEGYLETKTVLRHALTHRDDKMVYIFPTDQHPYKNAGSYQVKEFLHQTTYSMTGGAALASKLKMSVAFMHFNRLEKGKYSISFDLICKDASTMTPEAIMDRYYELLQKDIETDPANYLWSHKRWK